MRFRASSSLVGDMFSLLLLEGDPASLANSSQGGFREADDSPFLYVGPRGAFRVVRSVRSVAVNALRAAGMFWLGRSAGDAAFARAAGPCIVEAMATGAL